MKKPTLTFIVFCFISITFAQVGIGTVTPNNSALLDIQSVNKGLLLPRLTTDQKNNIPNPAEGLMVYDIDNKCVSINIGTPFSPNWECLNKPENATIPAVIVSTNPNLVVDSSNDRTWLDVPQLSATFELLEEETIKIDWTLFAGQRNESNNTGFAQMFTILEINGTRDVTSSNYFPMVHPGLAGNNRFHLMNNSTFSHAINLPAGNYTVQVQVFVAELWGSTNEVSIGRRTALWSGADNMTANEKRNAASNKLLITFL